MLVKILDIYYKRPLVCDLLINLLTVGLLVLIEAKGYYCFHFEKTSQIIPSIGITISGFILTMLTILLTLKSSSILNKENQIERKYTNNFQTFLASNLYSKAISVLRNGVVALLVVSFFTLGVSVLLESIYGKLGIYLNVICFILTLLVFLRSFYVLNLILKMQIPETDEN